MRLQQRGDRVPSSPCPRGTPIVTRGVSNRWQLPIGPPRGYHSSETARFPGPDSIIQPPSRGRSVLGARPGGRRLWIPRQSREYCFTSNSRRPPAIGKPISTPRTSGGPLSATSNAHNDTPIDRSIREAIRCRRLGRSVRKTEERPQRLHRSRRHPSFPSPAQSNADRHGISPG
jgi:hypothetical protein